MGMSTQADKLDTLNRRKKTNTDLFFSKMTTRNYKIQYTG